MTTGTDERRRYEGLGPMRIFTRHGCGADHRTYQGWARCAFPRAISVTGEGLFASTARCRGQLAIRLHLNALDAIAAKKRLDSNGCGTRCRKHHEVWAIGYRLPDTEPSSTPTTT